MQQLQMTLNPHVANPSLLSSILQKYANPKSEYQQIASKYATSAAHKIQKSLGDGAFKIADAIERSQSTNKNNLTLGTNNPQQPNQPTKSLHKIDPKEHKKLFRKLMREQVELEQRRNKNLEEMRKKHEADQRQQEIEREERFKSVMEEKRRLLEGRAKERISVQMKREEQSKVSNHKLIKMKQQKQLYQMMEEKYQNSIVFTSLEEKKQKLRQRRELSKPMSMSEIKTFEKQYLQRRQQLQTELDTKRNSLAAQRYEPPKKSMRLINILEAELNHLHEEEEERRKILSNNLRRSEQYSSLIKEKFKPRVQRSATPIIQSVTASREHRDQKLLGNDYLQYSKLRIKRNQSSSELKSTTSANQPLRTTGKTSKLSNYLETKDDQYYYNLRQKKLNQIIQSKEMSKREKIEEMNRETEKMDQAISRKNELRRLKKGEDKDVDQTQMLLASVRAKVGMLAVLES